MRQEVAEHSDLALKLLVGRSLKGGLPWTIEEDDQLIAQERLLWAALTPEEQKYEQQWLHSLWGRRGGGLWRNVPLNPSWGSWVASLGDSVLIPDAAFGMPVEELRPWGKGVVDLIRRHPDKKDFLTWLWQRGYQPTLLTPGVLTLVIPSHRVIQETERLLGLLLNQRPELDPVSIQLEAHYNPITGMATITLGGV